MKHEVLIRFIKKTEPWDSYIWQGIFIMNPGLFIRYTNVSI